MNTNKTKKDISITICFGLWECRCLTNEMIDLRSFRVIAKSGGRKTQIIDSCLAFLELPVMKKLVYFIWCN